MFSLTKVTSYKIFNILVIIALLLITYYINLKMISCTSADCLFRVKAGFYDPFTAVTPLLLTIFGFFLILPSHYFRRWLWYIASWAFPVLLYFISAESVYTSSIQSGPDFIAGIGMVILTAVTVLFVVGVFGYLQFLKYWRK